MWISWNPHRRTTGLCAAWDMPLHVIRSERKGLARWIKKSWVTLRLLRRCKPEILFVQNPSLALTVLAWLARPLFGYRLVVDAHNEGVRPFHRRGVLVRWLTRQVLGGADATIVTNAALAPDVTSAGGYPLILPDSLPEVPEISVERKFDVSRPQVVVISTFWGDEPVAAMMEAAAKLPQLQFAFTGDTGKLDQTSVNIPDNVRLTGYLPDPEYWQLLANSDIVCDLTLKSDCLVCGAYEALAVGKPMVLSDNPPTREIFGPAAMLTANTADEISQSLVAAIEQNKRLANSAKELRESYRARWQKLSGAVWEKIPECASAGTRRRSKASMNSDLPRILFVNINGNGTGHLSRCLAYARRMRGRAMPVFLSLASAIEVIQDMGFEADYFVSEFWSRSHINAWNRELALRVGLMLEEVRPVAAVFDGTWPFHGFMHACDKYGVSIRVWSNRGLHKDDFESVPVQESDFDLVIEPGEVGAGFSIERAERPGRKVTTPPVTLLDRDEILQRDEARNELGLQRDGRYALLSLGPGNFKDVSDIGHGLLEELRARGFTVVWARAPISVRDVPLPDDVPTISVYPLVRFLHAFDLVISAAGYNACCEIVQSGVPSLLVPNIQVADDQTLRAHMAARYAPVVVSSCDTPAERRAAVSRLLELCDGSDRKQGIEFDGASRAVDEILALVKKKAVL